MTAEAPTRPTPPCRCGDPRVVHELLREGGGYGKCSRCNCIAYEATA